MVAVTNVQRRNGER